MDELEESEGSEKFDSPTKLTSKQFQVQTSIDQSTDLTKAYNNTLLDALKVQKVSDQEEDTQSSENDIEGEESDSDDILADYLDDDAETSQAAARLERNQVFKRNIPQVQVVMDGNLYMKLSEEQRRRYGEYKQSTFENKNVKRLMAHVLFGRIHSSTLSQVSNDMVVVVKALSKLFVEDLVTQARQVAEQEGYHGPLRPDHVRRSHLILVNKGLVPGLPSGKRRIFGGGVT